MNTFTQLAKMLGSQKVKENVDIGVFLTLKVHTMAQYFYTATTEEDLVKTKKACFKLNIPFFILGGGSNLVITKKNIPGLVVHNSWSSMKIVSEDRKQAVIEVSSGYPVTRLVNETVKAGLAGFEYHLGLPGTVGGAIYMNSKWTKPLSYFAHNLISARLLTDNGAVKNADRSYFQFGYDSSILQKTKEIVLIAQFKLLKQDPEVLKKRSQNALAYRKITQPFGVASSGCFFRNISLQEKNQRGLPTTSAGYLIDRAGLKGLRIGDYVVSSLHANFILNKGAGNIDDLHKILQIVKGKVKAKFGVELKEEVIII